MVERILSTNSNKQEDKQTGTVFSTLLHLPDEEVWDIIKESCYGNKLPDIAGKIEFYNFWPHWPPDINHELYVEPDLFIRFENFDLIIEAKRNDKYQQFRDQWKSECSSYLKEYGENERKEKVFLIAVGGLDPKNLSPESKDKIHKCHWSGLLNTLYNYLEKYEITNCNQNIRIIKNCIEYLEYFNFKEFRWFVDMNSNLLNNIHKNSIKQLLKWGAK